MKTCKRCEETKPFAAFSPRRDARDGLAYWCTSCKTAATRSSPRRAEVTRAYYERNKTACLARTTAARAKDPERYAAVSRAATARHRLENREVVLGRRRAAYRENAAVEIARVMLRKERTTVLQPWVTQAMVAEMDGLYQFCRIFSGFEVDHIVPLNGKAVSGLHVPENLQVLTVRANRQKGNKYDNE